MHHAGMDSLGARTAAMNIPANARFKLISAIIFAVAWTALPYDAGAASRKAASYCKTAIVDELLQGRRAFEIDRADLFARLRAGVFGGTLRQDQVDGVNAVLDHWDRHRELKDVRWLAYLLATTYHETARTMQPVRETLAGTDEQAFQRLRSHFGRVKSYFRLHPETGKSYFGRGLVQLTWDFNYKSMGKLLGIGSTLFLTPSGALTSKLAVPIIFEGMIRGSFVPGHCLPRYFRDGLAGWTEARAIVNGRGRAREIARLGQAFLTGLEAARVTPGTGTGIDAGGTAPAAPPPQDRLAAIERTLAATPTAARIAALEATVARLQERLSHLEAGPAAAPPTDAAASARSEAAEAADPGALLEALAGAVQTQQDLIERFRRTLQAPAAGGD